MILWMTSIAVAAELSLQIDSRELVMGQTVPINLQVLNGRATGVPPIPVGGWLDGSVPRIESAACGREL